MRTPMKPLPDTVDSWMRRAGWLRWLDAVAAWLVLWIVAAYVLRGSDGTVQAVLAALLTGAGAFVPPVRAFWRPVSALVALAVSQPLRAGDRAWLVSSGEAELVVVTARRGIGVVVARLPRGPVEGVVVRRTQALLIPADPLRRG